MATISGTGAPKDFTFLCISASSDFRTAKGDFLPEPLLSIKCSEFFSLENWNFHVSAEAPPV